MTNVTAKPPRSTWFQPGNAGRFQPGNPGRPKGSRNAIAESFLSALHADFQANGAQAIADARAESPLGYVKMVAGLLPHELEVSHLISTMSDDELMQVINGQHGDAGNPDCLGHPTPSST